MFSADCVALAYGNLLIVQLQLHDITQHKREDRSEKATAVAHEGWGDVICRLARCRVTGEVSQVGENGYRCPTIHDGEHLETFNGDGDEAFVGLLKMPGRCCGRWGLQWLQRVLGHESRASCRNRLQFAHYSRANSYQSAQPATSMPPCAPVGLLGDRSARGRRAGGQHAPVNAEPCVRLPT
jgi:hypothetical protein